MNLAYLRVVAIPTATKSMGGQGLANHRWNVSRKATNRGYKYIKDFVDFSNLFSRIEALIRQRPYPCLKILEIIGHGSPSSADGIRPSTIAGFCARYKRLQTRHQGLCDETHIILTGCNTGLKSRSGADPIAKRVADGMPFDPNNFYVHVSVWGTAGYGIKGTSMEKNRKCQKGPVKYRGKWHHLYPGARSAWGRRAWNRFDNW